MMTIYTCNALGAQQAAHDFHTEVGGVINVPLVQRKEYMLELLAKQGVKRISKLKTESEFKTFIENLGKTTLCQI